MAATGDRDLGPFGTSICLHSDGVGWDRTQGNATKARLRECWGAGLDGRPASMAGLECGVVLCLRILIRRETEFGVAD